MLDRIGPPLMGTAKQRVEETREKVKKLLGVNARVGTLLIPN